MPSYKVHAIILAAGKGIRFGMPKVDAFYRGNSFLDCILNTLENAGIRDVFVARDLDTPDMLSSLRHAINELNASCPDAYLVFPVDHPAVQTATVQSLLDAFIRTPDAIIRPVYQGKAGHPIIIPKALNVFQEGIEGGLAQIIKTSHLPVVDITTNDMAILRNINLPEDLNLA